MTEVDVELRDLEIFLVLAKELHYGRTARQLLMSPPRVTRSIQSLERKIGGVLFRRTSRRVHLTRLGQQMLDRVGPTYEALVDAIDGVRGTARQVEGMLRIGHSASADMIQDFGQAISTFERRHPDAHVLQMRIDVIDILATLDRGDVDVWVTWMPHSPLQTIADMSMGPAIAARPAQAIVASRHPFASLQHVDIATLRGYPTLMLADAAPLGGGQTWMSEISTATPRPCRSATSSAIHPGQLRRLLSDSTTCAVGVAEHAHTFPELRCVPIRGAGVFVLVPIFTSNRAGPTVRAFCAVVGDRRSASAAPPVTAVRRGPTDTASTR